MFLTPPSGSSSEASVLQVRGVMPRPIFSEGGGELQLGQVRDASGARLRRDAASAEARERQERSTKHVRRVMPPPSARYRHL